MSSIVETNITARDDLIRIMLEEFNIRFAKKSEMFSEEFAAGVWLSGEERDQKIDGDLIFCFHSHSELYINGVHKLFRKFLDQHGWSCEWYDMGTIFAWPELWQKGV